MTKREYLNSLNHDLSYYNSFIDKKKFDEKLWHHGEQLSYRTVVDKASEILTELRTIETLKGYKPWK